MLFTQKRLKLYFPVLLAFEIFACLGFLSSIRSGGIDLRVYYTAGYMLRTGQSALLYDVPSEERLQNQLIEPKPRALAFFAPPFAAFPFAPLSILPYRFAFWALLACNLALLLLAAWIMRPYLGALVKRWPPLPFLLFLTFLPAGFTLVMGQLSILVLVFFCGGFVLLQRGRPILAGLVLSLALIKFQLVIPVVLLFALWRQWRFLLGFVAGCSLLAVASVLFVGSHECLVYLHTFVSRSGPLEATSHGSMSVAIGRMPNLYGLLASLTGNNHLSLFLAVAGCLGLLAWAATRPVSLPLALLLSVGAGFYLFYCDLTLLLLPVSLLCNRLLAEDSPALIPWSRFSWRQTCRRQLLFCALGIFLVSPILIRIIIQDVIFLLAIPVLALALCPCDWSTLALPGECAIQHLSEARATVA